MGNKLVAIPDRGSRGSVARLLERAAQRAPLGNAGGHSGARLERIVMLDGSRYIVKHISPEWDLTMRLTHDSGRAAELWVSGVLDRLPRVIDHAIVAAEPEGDGWVIVMRDVSRALFSDGRVLSRGEAYRILDAASAMHRVFWGEDVAGLCTLTDYLSVLSPSVAAAFEDSGPELLHAIRRGWELFPEQVPGDVAAAISTIHERPELLAEQLRRCGTTLIHGDIWLDNLGLYQDRVVMLDWGLATSAPPALEFTMFLTGAWSSIEATREQLIADFCAASGELHDERALHLAFLATFSMFGWNKAFDVVEGDDEDVRAMERGELDWWVQRVREALEAWSPV